MLRIASFLKHCQNKHAKLLAVKREQLRVALLLDFRVDCRFWNAIQCRAERGRCCHIFELLVNTVKGAWFYCKTEG